MHQLHTNSIHQFPFKNGYITYVAQPRSRLRPRCLSEREDFLRHVSSVQGKGGKGTKRDWGRPVTHGMIVNSHGL